MNHGLQTGEGSVKGHRALQGVRLPVEILGPLAGSDPAPGSGSGGSSISPSCSPTDRPGGLSPPTLVVAN